MDINIQIKFRRIFRNTSNDIIAFKQMVVKFKVFLKTLARIERIPIAQVSNLE